MGIQFAREPKQPGETLRYSVEYEPGVGLAVGDSLTGLPTVTVKKRSDGTTVTSTLIYGTPTREGNFVYFFLMGGVTGESYQVSVKCNTLNGEVGVEEDLVIFVKEL